MKRSALQEEARRRRQQRENESIFYEEVQLLPLKEMPDALCV